MTQSARWIQFEESQVEENGTVRTRLTITYSTGIQRVEVPGYAVFSIAEFLGGFRPTDIYGMIREDNKVTIFYRTN